jgi:hypothetical protein
MELGKKVFTSWVNFELAHKKVKINNLDTDLSDGSVLITLVEVLLNKNVDVPRASNSREQKIETITRLFQYLSQHAGINITVSPADIVDGSTKSIVMLLLLLVTHFHVEMRKKKTPKQESSKIFLVNWCRSRVAPAGLPVNNFASLQDGRVLGYILHSYNPKFVDYNNLKEGNALENVKLVLKAAETHFGIPQLIEPQDFVKGDDLSMLIYTCLFFSKVAGKNESKGRQSSSSSSSSSSDEGKEKKKLKVTFGARASVLSACPVCVNAINSKVTCSQCDQGVCEGCGSKFQSKLLGWDQPKFVCNNCLPLLKEKWYEEKRLSMALPQQDNGAKLQGHTGIAVGVSGTFSDVSPHAAHSPTAHAGAQVGARRNVRSVHAGHAHDSHPKTKIGKKLKSVEWQQEMINAKMRCTYCGSALSLLKRPHKCAECASVVCSTCSNIGFISFVLGWKGPRRTCQKCIAGTIRQQIHAKTRENPQLKEQADKEIRDITDWVNLNPVLRLKKRKDGKDGSESSPSSLSSSSSDGSSKGSKLRKASHTISVPTATPQSPKVQFSGSDSPASTKPKSGFGGQVQASVSIPSVHVHASTQGHAGASVSVPSVHASTHGHSSGGVSVPSVHTHATGSNIHASVSVPSVTAGSAVKSGNSKAPSVGSSFGVTLHQTPKKSKDQKKAVKLEWKMRSIQSGKACHACSAAFSLTKRPHKCKECSNDVCSSCVFSHFTLPFLGYTKPHNLCINCIVNLKTKISQKVKENPELRAEAVKGLKTIVDWINLQPALRVRKRKAGKDGSESSSSSSSSSDSDSGKKKTSKVEVSVGGPKVGVKGLGGATKMEIDTPKVGGGVFANIHTQAPASPAVSHAKVSAGPSPQVPRAEATIKPPTAKSNPNLGLKPSGSSGSISMPNVGVKLDVTKPKLSNKKDGKSGSSSSSSSDDEGNKKKRGLKLEGGLNVNMQKSPSIEAKFNIPKQDTNMEGTLKSETPTTVKIDGDHVARATFGTATPSHVSPSLHSPALPKANVKVSAPRMGAASKSSSSSSESDDAKKERKIGASVQMEASAKSPHIHAPSKDLKVGGKVDAKTPEKI